MSVLSIIKFWKSKINIKEKEITKHLNDVNYMLKNLLAIVKKMTGIKKYYGCGKQPFLKSRCWLFMITNV